MSLPGGLQIHLFEESPVVAREKKFTLYNNYSSRIIILEAIFLTIIIYDNHNV